jgi:beta-glucanase (GH16 family)
MHAQREKWAFRAVWGGLIGIATALVGIPSSLADANLLSNPGFEADAAGQHQNVAGWHVYGANAYNGTGTATAHSGSNYFKVYQAFNGSVNYSGIYQDTLCGPGAVYAATGWAFTRSSDALAGGNAAWIEVTFRDAAATVLALYRSKVLTTNTLAESGAFPRNTWNCLSVTNQYNSTTYQITNTVTRFVAPAGSVFVRLQVVFQGDAAGSGGSVYFDDLSLTQLSGAPYGDMNIVWCDEFNGSNLNTNIWTFDLGGGGWGNNELEYYTRRTNNVHLSDGLLHIRAARESYGGYAYTSARLKSQGLYSFKYGRIEWRAAMPSGVGYWPALWMLGTNITTLSWPGCGEIDVMENNGGKPGSIDGSIHCGSDATAAYTFLDGTTAGEFHTYTVDWSANAIVFSVDGHVYQRVIGWSSSAGNYPFPFNQPFFLIMNLAVGGNYLGTPSAATINAGTTFPGEMRVDYVRLYAPTDPCKISINRSNASLMLRWPGNIISRLQGQSDPSGIGDVWIDLESTNNQIEIFPTNACAFYRLVTP